MQIVFNRAALGHSSPTPGRLSVTAPEDDVPRAAVPIPFLPPGSHMSLSLSPWFSGDLREAFNVVVVVTKDREEMWEKIYIASIGCSVPTVVPSSDIYLEALQRRKERSRRVSLSQSAASNRLSTHHQQWRFTLSVHLPKANVNCHQLLFCRCLIFLSL